MIVQLESVEKRYGDVKALDGADLQIPVGSIMGLIGPNGAGKTTSMLIMSSLLGRDGGSVRIAGHDPEVNPKAVRRVIGYMPDFFGVYDGLIASEYLEFFASAHGVRPAARPVIASDLLELVGLTSKSAADVNTLSRGMKQRLSLARALVHDPDVLILDEPASGLDPRARVELRELIAELARMGKTIVISSHILAELEGICSHLAVVDNGTVRVQGTIGEIRQALSKAVRAIVRIDPDQSETAEEILTGSGTVGKVTVERDTIAFDLIEGEHGSPRLIARLVEAGIPIYEWRVESAGIEELFMALTEAES